MSDRAKGFGKKSPEDWRHIHRSKLLLTAVVSTLHLPVYAQPVQPPRADPLPMMQLATVLGQELRNMCIARFPDLRPTIEQQFSTWILKDVKIQVLVNGREYSSPAMRDLVETVRAEFQREPEPRARSDCEKISELLATFTRGFPDELLKPFLAAPAKP